MVLSFFNHVFIIFASIVAKTFPKNGKLQFCSSFFHVRIIFFMLFSFFSFFIISLSFFIIFASNGAKFFLKMENCNFPWGFSSFYYFFSSFFIILLPVVQKFSKKLKNAIFLFFLIIFYISFFHLFIMVLSCFIIFYHFCFQWCKNFPKNEKLQFSFFSFFYIFSLFIIF